MDLTQEQKATNFETCLHINRVRQLINRLVYLQLKRAEDHDQSKLEAPEVDLFTEYTPKLAASEYNSPEYQDFLKNLKPALDHHYGRNRHHPENHKNGVDDMNLIDILEMFCDWKAASERHNTGNLKKSIEINANRFNLAPQMVKIFENSINLFE